MRWDLGGKRELMSRGGSVFYCEDCEAWCIISLWARCIQMLDKKLPWTNKNLIRESAIFITAVPGLYKPVL